MSTFADIVMSASRPRDKQKTPLAGPLEFIEEPWGLRMELYPVQRVIVKAHYGVELDNSRFFTVTDWRRKNPRQFTEKTYLNYLFQEGRCNIREVDHERREMILSVGRRSGKTAMSACISAYETYKLIHKEDPQTYYGLPSSNTIQLISVATDKDQAGLLYQEVSGHFRGCAFFSQYMANNTLSYARFQTPKDIERYGYYSENPSAKATIKVTFRSCVAKGLRGAGNMVVILDEVAHFTDAGQSSAETVYAAVVPSTSAYSPKDPADKKVSIGNVEARVILISSPLGKQGLFYKQFMLGKSSLPAARSMLCIQAPTWEVNPSIEAEELEKRYYKDPIVFMTEYGAEFSDRTRGWIDVKSDVTDCIDPSARQITQGASGITYFMGVDLGLVNDGTAAAVVHINSDKKIVVDYVDQIKAGRGRFENKPRLEFDDAAQYIEGLTRRFKIQEGIFDQWSGVPFEQALVKLGLKQFKSLEIRKELASEMYQGFKDVLWNKGIILYNDPVQGDEEFCEYISELLTLQSHYHTKHVITVEAPRIDGKHDDLSDALVRAVYLASKKVVSGNYISQASVGQREVLRAGMHTRLSGLRSKVMAGGSDVKRVKPGNRKYFR